ncbi:MAG TPA: amino acid adenylation domain-containing protein, partial [Longimicrobiaceae bacterium]|nr:amino acid adenylation domain-containing protein [Longimicrobiaceae bacterium]
APFRSLLAAQRAEVLGALGAQAYPLERLVEQLQPERDAGRTPLFQAMFVLQQAARLPSATACALGVEGVAEERGPLVVEPVAIPQEAAQFDLVLEMGEVGDGLAGLLRYDADLFEPATARRMASHLVRLLEGIAADPDAPAGALELLADEERGEVLAGFNRTDTAYPDAAAPLHHLVEAQVRRSPDAPAVVFEGGTLTYADLGRRADRLAAALRARGVGPETRVGVCMERSPELVVALLGVLKAGGAYVPLDPDYPAERLAHMAADSAVPVLLAQPHLRGRLPESGAEVVVLDRTDPASAAGVCPGAGGPGCGGRCSAGGAEASPDNLAYVIYTSGSTGTPKGAMNAHRGVVNRLLWMQAEYALGPGDAVLQKTPFSFDVSVWELFWPLMVGARLVLARPGGHRDPAYLGELMEREGITTLHFVPSMLHAFLEATAAAPAGLRRVVCSGEALPAELQERFFERFPGVELHNLYGPTEAAVDVTSWACRPGEGRRSVPIGRPVANTRCYVLDGRLAPAPVGVPGELYLGGVQVGRGYLGRPGLTAERFVPDPFGEPRGGARLYRTGDLARWLPEGVLEYLGRTDDQVKVRGFRIEPGEIEAVLARHPGVRECAVVAFGASPGETRLAADLVPRGAAPGAAELREHLRGSLPEHMVPSAFVALERLPLTPSGQLDRRALPAPAGGAGRGSAAYVAPRSDVEALLAGIWAETRGVERVGVHDDFFDLGGHSLLAVRVASRVQEAFGVSLALHTLFQSPTVESLSRRV